MSDISMKYAQLGGASGWLGAPVGAETPCPDAQGRFRHYAKGSIYWHPSTGAHEVHGAIRDKWQSLGWELSWLGYPTTDETDVPGGRRSGFQNGRIDWSGAAGAVDSDGVDSVTYMSTNGDGHQAEFVRLRPLGYRIVSLNMYGSGSSPSYAATWVKRGGPTWAAAHGRTGAQIKQWGGDQAVAGLHPTIIAAIGSGGDALFSMVVERVTSAPPIWRIGLRFGSANEWGTFQYWCLWARANGYVLASLATYGEPGMLLVAAVWQSNTPATGWSTSALPQPASVDATAFGVQTAHGARPYLIERSEAPLYVSVYRDDSCGPWLARGNLSRAQMQTESAANKAQGYFPRAVVGSGTGASERFNVLFAKREHSLPNRFVVTGVDVAAMSAIDEAVAGYMRRNDIRAGTLAVAKAGALKFARGYTWGPPTYPITQPATLFRIGSISKTLTHILTHQLIERRAAFEGGGIGLESEVQRVLGLTPPPGLPIVNRHFAGITVRHCLTHRSGVSRNFAHLDAEVTSAFGSSLPVGSKREIAAMLMTKAPEFAPDERSEYANSGYLLLAAVIEHVTGRPWFDVLRTNVLNPLGLTRPRVSGSLLSQRVEGEALYHDPNLTLVRSVMTAAQPLVRDAYGNPNLAVGDAVGGMAFSAADLVKLYAALLPSVSTPVLSRTTIDDVMWSTTREGWMTPRPESTRQWIGHNGGLANMQAFAFARPDDEVVFAVAFNKEMNGFEPPPIWNDLLEDVESYPAHDLFPSLGISPFA